MINLRKICIICSWRNTDSKYCNKVWHFIKCSLLVMT